MRLYIYISFGMLDWKASDMNPIARPYTLDVGT